MNPRVGCRRNVSGSWISESGSGTPPARTLRGAQRSKPSKPGGTARAEGAGESGISLAEGGHRLTTTATGTGRGALISTEGHL
jgi:hypothetical protein